MLKALEKLVKIANQFDQSGLTDYADRVDMIVLAVGQRTRAVDDFIQELKRIFKVVANDQRVPSINSENLEVILNVIDTLANKGTFLNPSNNPAMLRRVKEMDDGVVQIVDGLLELENSVKKLKEQLATTTNPEKRNMIEDEMGKEHELVIKLMEQVNHWKAGNRKGDKEQYEKFLELYKSKKEELGI